MTENNSQQQEINKDIINVTPSVSDELEGIQKPVPHVDIPFCVDYCCPHCFHPEYYDCACDCHEEKPK